MVCAGKKLEEFIRDSYRVERELKVGTILM